MLAILSGFFRRLLGGWLSSVPIIKERGFQWVLCFCLYFPVLYFMNYNTWLFDLLPTWLFATLGALGVIYAETKGHFPGFQCGMESIDYINECLAKGRKIPYQKFVDWLGEKRGFEQFGKEWCFWQLILCKTVCCIVPSLFVGWHFMFIGLAVGFVYPALYWVELKPFKKIMVTPTNWGEFFQGVLYFQGLLI